MTNILFLNLPHKDLCSAIDLLESSKDEFRVFVADTDGLDREVDFYAGIRVFDMPSIDNAGYTARLETLVESLGIDYIHATTTSIFPRLAKIEDDNK
jgi:hypothetical protein